MEFKSYQHVERLGTAEVENIELGECFVFPKIDGSNASAWLSDGVVQGASRKRHLTLESDNAGFLAWLIQQNNIREYLIENPTHRLFGEWLVPHSLQTYRSTAWKQFYVFDVCTDRAADEILHDGDSHLNYLHYNEYKPLLEKHNIAYVPPLCKITNGSYEQFINQLLNNIYLIEDGKGAGEGIVIKRYDFRNQYNRQTWAKIVTSEFKEKHAKAMGENDMRGKKMIEEEIAVKYTTTALVEKEHAKISTEEQGWSSKHIPRLLNTVYYSVVKEDCWEFVKENKNPTIDFKRLQHFVFREVKQHKPELF